MDIKNWTSLHAFTPSPRSCSCCHAPILAVKKVNNTVIYGCPRCDYLYRTQINISEEAM